MSFITPLNKATKTTAQWYRFLVEQEVTIVNTDTARSEYINSRAGLASPETDWEESWRLELNVDESLEMPMVWLAAQALF